MDISVMLGGRCWSGNRPGPYFELRLMKGVALVSVAFFACIHHVLQSPRIRVQKSSGPCINSWTKLASQIEGRGIDVDVIIRGHCEN